MLNASQCTRGHRFRPSDSATCAHTLHDLVPPWHGSTSVTRTRSRPPRHPTHQSKAFQHNQCTVSYHQQFRKNQERVVRLAMATCASHLGHTNATHAHMNNTAALTRRPVRQLHQSCSANHCGSADEVCLSSSRATRQPRRTCAGARHWQTLRLSPGGRRCATRHSHARSPAHRLAVSGTHCTESQHAARRAAHKPCRLRSSPFEPM